ncbi:EcsC family protein [Fictibacillus aquaticus]|uniref:ABC transporter substrate-binding protein n=1 Tax=Fictibacillus aquaticus TaxID=2021314 RepID=A0A235FA39_9BACL|nr:EcsC family protein [Fictibacillus aquaticus]OYD58200.1 ABC transporter substrate-binding protein [Fictibacillus aquaticus]
MNGTVRDEQVWRDIESWENDFFTYEPTDFGRTYDKWVSSQLERLPSEWGDKVSEWIDTSLFHIHAAIQNSQFQLDTRQRILSEARTFREDIYEIEDLQKCTIDQLIYMAEQEIARNRLASLAQGGLAGTGGVLLLGSDFPAAVTLGVRSVQSIALHYGFDIQKPAEMMRSLKVFHMATLPKKYQAHKWDELFHELQTTEEHPIFYAGNDEVADITWLSQPLKQGIKALAIVMLRKKLVQGIPLFGMALGAAANYQQARKITEIAHRFYQKRFLLENRRL